MKTYQYRLFYIFLLICITHLTHAATIISNNSGNWSSTSTWQGGVVPGAGDSVVITNWHTITIDQNVTVKSINVYQGHITIGNSTTSRTVSISDFLTVGANGWCNVDLGAFDAAHSLTVGKDITVIQSNTFRLFSSATRRCNLTLGGNFVSQVNIGTFALASVIANKNGSQSISNSAQSTTFPINGNLTVTNGSTLSLGNHNYTYTWNISGNVQVDAGASIIIPAFTQTHTMSISGFITNNGTIDLYRAAGQVCNATIGASGSVFATSSTSEFNNLTINTGVGVTLQCGSIITTRGTCTNNGTITGPTTAANYARIVNSSAIANASGSIGASSSYIACSGTISGGTIGANVLQSSSQTAVCIVPTITVSTSTLSGFSYCFGSGPSAFQSYTVSGTDLSANIVITAPTDYEISTSSGSGYTSTLTLTRSGTVVNTTTIYVRLRSGRTAGNYNSQNITHTSTGATTQNISCSGTVTSGGPTISTHPSTSNQTYCFNATATALSVVASGSGLTYQWYFNTAPSNSGGTIISGANSSSYTPPTNASNTRYYYVIVTGSCSPAATSNVSGSITTQAQITTPGTITSNSPQCQGTGITFTKGSCPGGSTCYWVSSATGTETSNSSNTLTTATTTGTYTVYVRASNGTCWSNAASATGSVNAAPAISSHPSTASQSVCQNAAASQLQVVATGGTLTYQWYSNTTASNSGGSIISGATSATYTPSTSTPGTLYYYCIVSSTCSPAAVSNVSGSIITRPLPTPTASASPNPVFTNEILYLSGGPNGMASYAWTGPNGFSSSLQNPTLSGFTTSASGIYTLTTTNVYGCTGSASTSSVIVNTATTFYSKSTGNLNDVNTWGPNTDGSGTVPANFTASGQTFIIRNNTTPTIGANWTVSGIGSKVIVGNGTDACNFTIPSNFSFTGIIDVRNNATLTISNNTVPTLSILSSGSTVIFNSSGAQTIPANNYYNLTISGARTGTPTITLASETISCSGAFSPNATGCNWATTGNTFIFDGTGDQNIPAFTYNNLHTELGGTKTLTGNITVKDKLRIGAISKLSQGIYNITLEGSETVVTLVGTFIPGTSNTDGQSTVYYTSASNATVAAMNYRNLDLGNGPRTFQETNIINVSRTFTPGGGIKTVTNSTFCFNGSTAQLCPAFTFYNLEIANTTSNGGVTLNGNITVQNLLTLRTGLITTTSLYSVHVTNTNNSAISIGTSTSYINGKLTRSFVANLTSQTNEYFFPIGHYTTSHNYLPFTVRNVTTGAIAPTLSAQAIVGANAATAGTGLTAVSTSEYWSITYTGNFTSGVISLTKTSGLGSFNAIGHRSTAGSSVGAYTSIKGSVQGTTTIINSEVTTFSFFVLGTLSPSPATYYYRGSGTITDVANWTTSSNGIGGTSPTNFTTDNATYIVTNTTAVSLTSNWSITGTNTSLKIGNGSTVTELIVTSGATLSTSNDLLIARYGKLTNTINSTINISGNLDFVRTDNNAQLLGTLTNSGGINVYGSLLQREYSYSTITNENTGIINLYNDFIKGEHTYFYNEGLFNQFNGNFTLTGNSTALFENRGTVKIDNSGAPLKKVEFGTISSNIDLSKGMKLLAGSVFHVIKSDIEINGAMGGLTIAGDLIVEDGNIIGKIGGSSVTVTETGGVYAFDRDNTGDGVVSLNYGGTTLIVDGQFYAEGLNPINNGGNDIRVNDGAVMFIGNIGLYTGTNNNSLVVENGGTLNYCGNKTALADNLGTINPGGLLNYAGGYYTIQNPGNQLDFDVDGYQVQAFEDAETCRLSFLGGGDFDSFQLLPIELTMLNATCTNGIVSIMWQTASEQNNDFFTIYRSYDGIIFTAIATVSGAGYSNTLLNYMYEDNTLAQGIVYYKLAQTDYDGTTVYSKILAVSTCGNPAIYSFKEGEITISFEHSETPHHVIITSIDGKILFSKVYTNTDSATIYTPFANGIYVISTVTNNSITSEKFVIKN